MQRACVITGFNGDRRLKYDGPRIHTLIDKVHGTTGHFRTVIQCLLGRMDAWKGGAQRRMRVQDAARERGNKPRC